MAHRYLTKTTTKSLLALAGVVSVVILGAGCGGSSPSASTTTSTTTTNSLATTTLAVQPTNIGELCSTSCTDEAGDKIDEVKLLSGDIPQNGSITSEPRVVSFQLTIINRGSGAAEVDLSEELKILDSEQHQLGLDQEAQTPSGYSVRACEDVGNDITLEPGETHSYTVCFDLPNSKDFPRVALFDDGDEIPFK